MNPEFRMYQQQDAHACLSSLLNRLQSLAEPDFVEQIFGGRLRSRLQCTHCLHVSETFDQILDLSLAIEGPCSTLSNALELFTRLEQIEGLTPCEKCEEKVSKVKELKIEQAPEVLVLHLKRFNNDGSKIIDIVNYPFELDLKPFLSKPNDDDNETKYDLYVVLVHAGYQHKSGHYYCYILPSMDSCHILNDEKVKEVRLYDARYQDAYILFYKRIGTPWFTSLKESCTSYTTVKEKKPESEEQKEKKPESVEQKEKKPESVEQDFTVNVSDAQYSPSLPDHYSNTPVAAGLFNLGNTCFFNVVLQCLTHTAPFVEGVKTCEHICAAMDDDADFCLLCYLKAFMVDTFKFSGDSFSPYQFVNNLSNINHLFKANQQQDAHEFLRCMLNKVQESTEPNFVEQIFGGQSRSRLQCTHCHHVSDTFESLLDLSLAIQDVHYLSDALELFTRLEQMPGLTPCEKCKEKVPREKGLQIEQAPEVLVLHLLRFNSNAEKIIDFVYYPFELDLKPFLSNPNGDGNGETKYDLYAVLVHDGNSSSSGHYFCYVRPSLDSWYNLDDAKVTPVAKDKVLRQAAYILFYKRIGTPWFTSLSESSTTVKAKKLKIKKRESVEQDFTVNVSNARYSPSLPDQYSNTPVAAGLFNLGNTCFFNAVLQCLTHTAPFIEGVKTCEHICSSRDFCFLCLLKEFMADAFKFSGDSFSPYQLVNNLSDINHLFKANQQQDAHEFLRCMLDKVRQSAEPNFVEQTFGGHSRSRLQCTHCHHVSDTFESLLDLSLAIKGVLYLSDALELFTRLEQIQGSTPCEKCKEKVPREKGLKIEQAPEVLVLHLKRFDSNAEKIIDFVYYPFELDLKPFLSNPNGDSNRETKYDLYAVLVHDGNSSSSGHYFCYVRPSPDSWYNLDDAKVTPVSEYEVTSQDAYILFYKRKGTPWFTSLKVSSTTAKVKKLKIKIMKPVEYNFTRIVSNTQYSCTFPDDNCNIPVAAGLVNLGNTCFLNAVLQCLTHTGPFIEGLKTCKHALICSNINNLFKANQQQDAHEFLRCMLNKVQESTEPNFVEQIFGGQSRSRLQCTHCHHVSDTFESLLDLSLAIQDVHYLSDALELFTRLEQMPGLTPCEKCKEKVPREKGLKIEQAPEVLVLHLLRFNSNAEKIIDFVYYPFELDLKPFLSNPNGDGNRETKYDLYAVLVHDGNSSSSGHYFCYVRPSPDSWYNLDDAKVTPVTKYVALTQVAYILFYKRKGTLWFSSLEF
ncbi:hypothetical protein CKAN_01626100 [Cinnamomum micranthum f. kanehirae]|uniref:USP domain-containing protein n=1 Tax=Cinnamomum micranthum f. kanehirae TaxID=337451 RepID=A0A443P968_9MAGN|nr:hypothetical protein CKAN_01626100 [Cinnamomum micranthum f. kanehirae]